MSIRPRLLVVDDEPDFAAMAAEVGADCGYDTRTATDGRAAMAAVADFRPDVILADVVMPEMDGIEFVRWLGQEGYAGRVVLISGYDRRYMEMALLIGQSARLAGIEMQEKPIRVDQLRLVLNRLREPSRRNPEPPRSP